MTSKLRGFFARWGKAIAAAALFVAAVQGIGAAADALDPTLSGWLEDVIERPLSALGAGWLVTYLLASGSVVAGLAVTLIESATVDPVRGFLLLAGSRLGAAAFVVLLGVVEFARAKPRPPLHRALGLGVLTFLVTLTVYVPATVLGYALFDPLNDVALDALPAEVEIDALAGAGEAADELVDLVGAIPVAAIALVLVFASLQLFDRSLQGLDEERMRGWFGVWLRRPWLSFAVGLLLTTVTTSVALSVGALVPLFSRGIVKARELAPYLLGAGIGTMADTALFALVLGSESGLAVVLVLVACAALATLALLLRSTAYSIGVERVYRAVVTRAAAALGFAVSLLTVPALLFLYA